MSAVLAVKVITLKDKHGEKLFESPGTSLVQLHPSLVFIDLVLDNAAATQNFEYEMFSILDNPMYILLQFLITRLTPSIEEYLWAFSAITNTRHSRTTLVARVCCRSTCSVKHGALIPFVGLSLKGRDMVLAVSASIFCCD